MKKHSVEFFDKSQRQRWLDRKPQLMMMTTNKGSPSYSPTSSCWADLWTGWLDGEKRAPHKLFDGMAEVVFPEQTDLDASFPLPLDNYFWHYFPVIISKLCAIENASSLCRRGC